MCCWYYVLARILSVSCYVFYNSIEDASKFYLSEDQPPPNKRWDAVLAGCFGPSGQTATSELNPCEGCKSTPFSLTRLASCGYSLFIYIFISL
jgi:hypothetical protein